METPTPRVVVHRRQQPPPQQEQPRQAAAPRALPRPVSLYDNLKQPNGSNGSNGHSGGPGATANYQQQPLVRGGASSVGNLNAVNHVNVALTERSRTPSQANCLSTTVPQNMAAVGFASRHAPTRSSLRHSRMIVMTREGRVPHKYQPGVLRRRRLGTALSALVCLLGALVTAVAVWLLLWAPNLPARDNPVYSGPPLVAAGLLGLVLLGCCRKDYPGRPYSCCMFSFKVLSVSLAALAALAALCASAFALLHVVSLWGSACEPAKQVVNATCTCEPAHKDPERSWAIWWGTVRHVYPDLSCPEVESLLSVILTGSGAANLLAGVLAGWYVLLHWRSRYTDVYAKVRTAPPPVVISNVSKA
ncbi:uncharacterized protein LOC117640376 isoform X1 [Thrips palmi]|uniref:Uncharacterized protein LOC117640376 isoform X1 n=1 Tax=Thrips palmi TaxID=161013 RepID=A0A6P8Y7Y2_THRPL|nr:uncharacterized protein LOC117640376 isoform X1 [Thrips palmi]XP_034232741.1 uncharacterized protein LOC117640376 isoform X1 [Thrips palmi]